MIKKLNFSWIIPDQLAASALPTNRKELEWLVKIQKIRCIISLNETPLNNYIRNFPEIKSKLGFTHYHIPTMDGTGFFPHQFQKMVEIFSQQEKRPLLFHCTGGYGRTSTALVAIWMKMHQLPLNKAMADLRRFRPQIMVTSIQITSLEEWERIIQQPDDNNLYN